MPAKLHRLIATVPSRPAGDLNDEQLLAKTPESKPWNLTVTRVRRLAPRMLRLSVSAPGLEEMNYFPGQDLTVLVERAGGRDIRRRYTLAGRDSDTVDLDVFVHGDGVGTAWALACRPGDPVKAIGPRGKISLDAAASWHVFVGDETYLPAIRAMLRGTNGPAQVVLEVDDPDEWQSMAVTTAAIHWTWLPRGRVTKAALALELPTADHGHAYVSGEASRVQTWCGELERLGLERSAISHKAYWGRGRANATHGEPLT